jgi:hypothetical protein
MGKHSAKPARSRLLRAGAAIGLLISVGVVWQSSQAAFTDTTTNPGNTWTAGSVTVTDDQNGTKVFNLSGLKPGDSGDACIVVTYAGTLTNSTVKFYVNNFTDNSTGGAWGGGITLTVTTGGGTCPLASITGQTTAVNNKSLSFLNTNNDYPAGTSMFDWTNPANNATRPYNVHYAVSGSLADDGDDGIQGKTATLDLVWEAS